MILDGQEFITTQWQQATIPGLAVVVTGLGLSLPRRRAVRPAHPGAAE